MVPFGLNGITVPKGNKKVLRGDPTPPTPGFLCRGCKARWAATSTALLLLPHRQPRQARPGNAVTPTSKAGFNWDLFVGAAQTALPHGGGKLHVASQAPPTLVEVNSGQLCWHGGNMFSKTLSYNYAGKMAEWYRRRR